MKPRFGQERRKQRGIENQFLVVKESLGISFAFYFTRQNTHTTTPSIPNRRAALVYPLPGRINDVNFGNNVEKRRAHLEFPTRHRNMSAVRLDIMSLARLPPRISSTTRNRRFLRSPISNMLLMCRTIPRMLHRSDLIRFETRVDEIQSRSLDGLRSCSVENTSDNYFEFAWSACFDVE